MILCILYIKDYQQIGRSISNVRFMVSFVTLILTCGQLVLETREVTRSWSGPARRAEGLWSAP